MEEYIHPNHGQVDEPERQSSPNSTDPMVSIDLGHLEVKTAIASSMGPFYVLQDHKIHYPPQLIAALKGLYREYNRAFHPSVEANREWDEDYQYCVDDERNPLNHWVQIDMVGSCPEFLDRVARSSVQEVTEAARRRIFEIENSLAMTPILNRLFESDHRDQTHFDREFRASLERIRQQRGKPIALLATTEEKYLAVAASEFGEQSVGHLSDQEVRSKSGFDKLFSPDSFQKHLQENGGRSQYLLYVRSSDPVAKLKNPDTLIHSPLLGDSHTRRIIRANTLTLNIDAPEATYAQRINDTKAYLAPMNMAHDTYAFDDIFTDEFMIYLSQKRTSYMGYPGHERLNQKFKEFLNQQGVSPESVEFGNRMLRAKPLKGTYGCYGHFRGNLGDKSFRQDLKRGLKQRTGYVIQPELSTPQIINTGDGNHYTYIDRVFFTASYHGEMNFMGGFRSFMPMTSIEAKEGRNHGSNYTVWAEIL